MSYDYYLVCGTMQELRHIAEARSINPKTIRLVQYPNDIHGHRGGELILGYTGPDQHFLEIVQYARQHDIKIPWGGND